MSPYTARACNQARSRKAREADDQAGEPDEPGPSSGSSAARSRLPTRVAQTGKEIARVGAKRRPGNPHKG
jgi:hypothetical protein